VVGGGVREVQQISEAVQAYGQLGHCVVIQQTSKAGFLTTWRKSAS